MISSEFSLQGDHTRLWLVIYIFVIICVDMLSIYNYAGLPILYYYKFLHMKQLMKLKWAYYG